MAQEISIENLAENIERLTTRFIQLPAANPIIKRGTTGEWDETLMECAGILKDWGTYYLYYHAKPAGTKKGVGTGYQIGVATASHPLGPWTKYEGNPIIDHSPEGSWESQHVTSIACPHIIKEGEDKYYMWYCGTTTGNKNGCNIALAIASNPLGPWTKHEGNPIIEDFGYPGSVIKVDGKYMMYAEYPIAESDYGNIAVATADQPEGPWTIHEQPVLTPSDWGAWDDGGYSESNVVYNDGIFHMFYGGSKIHPQRMKSEESIGYAYSFDGFNFKKHPRNPVVVKEKCPDTAAFGEVHAFFEHPFIYCFHTIRSYSEYLGEDIGVQVLATDTPFQIRMPALILDSIDAATTTSLDGCPPICLDPTSRLAVTAEGSFSPDEKFGGLRIKIRSSYDGVNFDTMDLESFELVSKAGETVRQTVGFDSKVRYIKIVVQNLSRDHKVDNVKVFVTLGS